MDLNFSDETVRAPDRPARILLTCPLCGAPVGLGARFCAACGVPVPAADPPAPSPATDGAPNRTATRRWPIIAVCIVLVAALLSVLVYAVFLRAHPAEAAIQSAGSSVSAAVQRLAAASSTADLRSAAEVATEANGQALNVLPGLDPADRETLQLQSYSDFLGAVGELSAIDGDSLGVWKSVSGRIDTAVARMGAGDERGADLAAAARPAVAHAGDVVARAGERMASWRADVAAGKRDNEAKAQARSGLAGYESIVRGQLRRYASLRTDTETFVEMVEDPAAHMTYEIAFDHLSEGADARRSVRDGLAAADVPSALADEHGRLIAMLEDAAAAMDAAYGGLSESVDCLWYYDDCYYAETSGWRTFRSESSRISTEFANAVSAWEAGVSAMRADLQPRDLPTKPVV